MGIHQLRFVALMQFHNRSFASLPGFAVDAALFRCVSRFLGRMDAVKLLISLWLPPRDSNPDMLIQSHIAEFTLTSPKPLKTKNY